MLNDLLVALRQHQDMMKNTSFN